MKKAIYSFIYYRILGWKTNVTVPDYDKCVITAAPHTSNWDLFIGKLFYGAIGRKTYFMMKKEWFFFPLGLIFKAVGGIPVDRGRKTSLVDQMTAKFANSKKFQLKMLHFFINTGIKDTAYYWNELSKCMNVYCELKAICPELDSLNIGGGFPIKNSLNFEYDYEYLTEEIIAQIKNICHRNDTEEPNIFTEFGSFTVGESGAALYSIVNQKQQNDRENWYMIDSSFITTLPDTWGINQRYIMLAVNNWDREYQRVLLGGLTCDSEDFYNAESHTNAIFLPKLEPGNTQYIGFFHTGAYQESLGGFGGIQHCLIPAPKHIIIDRDKSDNEYYTRLFAKEQSYRSMLRILGY